MEGNTIDRILRLTKHLLNNPNSIPLYLKKSITKKTPMELELPWISYAAIKFLENYKIDSKHEILELGGGGSTLFFGKTGAKITCLESSEKWAEIITKKCNSLELNNVKLEILPYDINSENAFLGSDFYKFIGSNKQYDIILIDNYEEETQLRPFCFYEAEKSIKPGGIIIVDDSWRYISLREKNSAIKHITFQSIGPSRIGVTTTDIYFY